FSVSISIQMLMNQTTFELARKSDKLGMDLINIQDIKQKSRTKRPSNALFKMVLHSPSACLRHCLIIFSTLSAKDSVIVYVALKR
ncbi:MAG: hypothetical protein WCF03_13060, partial [Nitrososphaeraceae archaeon]